MTKVEVDSQAYNGPERRQKIVLEQCVCHLKHETKLTNHDRRLDNIEKESKDDLDAVWTAIKSNVPFKLFLASVVLICGALGWLLISSVILNVKAAEITTLQQTFINRFERIEKQVEKISTDLNDHRVEYRKTNGKVQ